MDRKKKYVKKYNPDKYKRDSSYARVPYQKKAYKPYTISNDVVYLGSGFPDRLRLKQKYSEIVYISTSPTNTTYRANGMFDPQVAVGGHQPLYFDQLSQLYARFKVISASCNIEGINRGGSDAWGICIYPSSDPAPLGYLNALEQQFHIPNTIVPVAQGDVKRLSSYEKSAKMIGTKLFDDQSWGSVTADPVSLWYFHIDVQNLASIPTTTQGEFRVVIEYYAEWFDRFAVTAS
jgi:hypothetical protein